MTDCPNCNAMPAYHDAAELDRRKRLMEAKARNPDSLDKPIKQQNKPVRFRTMTVKKQRGARRRYSRKSPEFL